jgi:TraM recognition site of TraD and TraG
VGLVRGLQRRPAGRRTLLSVDEAPAVALPRLPTWLATVGGPPAAVTCCVYTQSVPDLERVYGRDETRAILSNCAHQVWFPPRDADTARCLAELLGERLVVEPGASRSTQERGAGLGAPGGPTGGSAGASLSVRHRPVLTPAQALALPRGTVACVSQALRFLAADSRTALEAAVGRLPPPPAPAREPETSAADGVPEDITEVDERDEARRWAALLAQLDEAREAAPDAVPDGDRLRAPAADVAEPAPAGDVEPPAPTAYW